MSVNKITPYLFFNGQGDSVISFYEKALGARSESVLRWGDNPEMCPAGKEKQIMHASLQIGPALLFLSDSARANTETSDEQNSSLAIEVSDAKDMDRMFAALTEGGTVIEPIHDAFWGEKFGVLRDRFGVTWMFTCPKKSE